MARFAASKLNDNSSYVRDFQLLSLVSAPEWQTVLFGVFCFIYTATVIGNLMIVMIILHDPRLHKPMYFFLANLSVLEIFYTTSITPNTLKNFLQGSRTISFVGCFTQMFFFTGLGSSECVLLSCMAYDRYVAICRPLYYSTIMKPVFCVHLMVVSWGIGFSNSLGHTVQISTLPFCKEHLDYDFFCDIPSVAQLSCSDTSLDGLVSLLIAASIILATCTLTVVSYVCILRAVLNIHSAGGRWKAFSTCGSHLTVVTLYFGTVILVYAIPESSSFSAHKRVLSVMYGIITPFINPIVYSFRNTEFQNAINKMIVHGKNNLRRN